MLARKTILTGAGALTLAACATTPTGLPPVAVTATAETVPVGTGDDAADDPAIWRNRADPEASLIVATDKNAGLYVYGLDGRQRGFVEAGEVNNVDIADMGEDGVIVVASDRNNIANAKVRVYRLETDTAQLDLLGIADVGPGEGYGLCLAMRSGQLIAYSPVKEGQIYEHAINLEGGVSLQAMRTLTVPSQPEGCVVDPRDGTLFVGEEVGGIWRFAAGSTQGSIVAAVDNRYLVADVEGLALAPEGAAGGYLVASSQGDNAFAVFSLPDFAPLGRFGIAEGTYGATEETDGIELVNESLGPEYPDGLFVAQDGMNRPETQNFKLVGWGAIKAAMGLD